MRRPAGYGAGRLRRQRGPVPVRGRGRATTLQTRQHFAPLQRIDRAQLFRIPATPTDAAPGSPAPVYTVHGTTRYCLQPGARNVVRPVTCTGGAAQNWIRYGDTGVYRTKYRLVHAASGNCLTRTGPEDIDRDPDVAQQHIEWHGYADNFKVMAIACREATARNDDDGFNKPSLVNLQKWNSPGSVLPDDSDQPAETVPAGPLRDLVEV
ncbi:hypothetical protein GCM10010123_45400 [Pilimelia anulata]|uniref:Ricin B lectin domain-containing protein n=1 Tax=Pilimelia anulata TaxID=53371 RepID=A0A8J3BH02_9ACTN|nr:hypothetical protein [Pilimelia anulata]GGK10325.1 hypothetical protein GCM10010123_45400 [Pilimelia anulata]